MRWLILLLLAGTAAADAPVAGPPAGGKRAPTQAPAGEIAIIGKQAYDETTLTVDVIVTKLNMIYMTGLKRCYNEHLKRNPDARGRMVLQFTVTWKGRMDLVETRGFNVELDQCVLDLARSWSFPIPKDKAGTPTKARFAFDFAFD